MHDQSVAGRQLGEQIFSATRQRPNGLAPEASHKSAWEWLPEIASVEDDTVKARPAHDGLQTSSRAFDFRKFGHSFKPGVEPGGVAMIGR
jgi:hypothetical protein